MRIVEETHSPIARNECSWLQPGNCATSVHRDTVCSDFSVSSAHASNGFLPLPIANLTYLRKREKAL